MSKKLRNAKSGEAISSHRSYELGGEAWDRGAMTSAFRYFLIAARGGVKPAYRTVAQFYGNGQGTAKSEKDALRWYRRACWESGDPSAANNIGCIMRDKNEINKALWWLRQAVKMGDGEAHMNIAKIYLEICDDQAKAMRHLEGFYLSPLVWSSVTSSQESSLLDGIQLTRHNRST